MHTEKQKVQISLLKCGEAEVLSNPACYVCLHIFTPDDETLALVKGHKFISIKSHSSHSYEAS